jgi:hypothetical protein
MQFAGHLSQATAAFTWHHTSGNSVACRSDLGLLERLSVQRARNLKFPQLSAPVIRQGNRLFLCSIQRCGGWADMGQWVVSVLGPGLLHLRATFTLRMRQQEAE